MKFRLLRLVAAALVPWVGSRTAAAQIDYRNLESGLPGRVTDATPVERFAFELSFPHRLSFGRGATEHVTGPHLEYGLARNFGLGAGLEVASEDDDAVSLGLFWNPLRETVFLPAIAVALDLTRPIGQGIENADLAMAVTLIATRAFGRSRTHLNLEAAPLKPASGEIRWSAGLGWDYTLFRSSTLFVAEVGTEKREALASLGWTVGAGIRRQIGPTWVAHVGVNRGVSGIDRRTEIGVGLSYAFAVAGLMGRRRS